MTGSQTDRINVPAYHTASCILLKLASPIFCRWRECAESDNVETPLFKHWFNLRKVAERFTSRRSMEMSPAEREKLVGALKFAHDLAHDYDPEPAPSVERCGCETASLLVDLAMVMAVSDAEAVHAA